MFLHYFLSNRKHRIGRIFPAVILVASGCASNSVVRAQQEELDSMKKQFAELKSQVGTLGTRLESVEGKLTVLTTPPQPISGLKPTGISGHPSEGIGSPPESLAAAGDPEPGFINDEAVQDFRKAMILFEAGRYSDASSSFASFLERYPDHPFAGAAQFYVGKSFLRQKDYVQAYDEFQRVLTTYDRSSHVAETLRDLAETEELLHKSEDAARHRQLLSSLFPQSPAYATVAPNPRSVVKEASHTSPDEFAAPPAPKRQETAPKTLTGSRATQLDEPPPPASSVAPPTAPVEKVAPKTKPNPQPGDVYPATEDKS